jgi:hypothetical protein
MAGILSRAELPSWVRPHKDGRDLFSIFYAFDNGAVVEYLFCENVMVALVRAWSHSQHDGSVPTSGTLYWFPPDVLIAASVECLRRSR